jgi:DnaJ-class molecular chaperone
MKDHYAALGLSPSATLADIKKAYRQQAALHHPDRNSAADAAARFRLVQVAYEVLSDPDKRKAYDDNRQRNLLDSPIDTARVIWNDYFDRLLRGGLT